MQANVGRAPLIALLCGYVLYLGATNQLGLYVHPRYHLFTMIASAIGMIVMAIDSIRQIRAGLRSRKANVTRKQRRPAISTLLFITIIAIVCLIILFSIFVGIKIG